MKDWFDQVIDSCVFHFISFVLSQSSKDNQTVLALTVLMQSGLCLHKKWKVCFSCWLFDTWCL